MLNMLEQSAWVELLIIIFSLGADASKILTSALVGVHERAHNSTSTKTTQGAHVHQEEIQVTHGPQGQRQS